MKLRPFISLFLAFLLVSVFSVAQQSNSCGLIAKMIPQGDSVVNTPTSISIQNNSINATGYKIFVDEILLSTNQPVNIGIGVGLTKVKLVAYNGICSDTVVSYYFNAGKYSSDLPNIKTVYGFPNREHQINGITNLKNGSNLIFGHKIYEWFSNDAQTGVLIKTNQTGCVEWARKIQVYNYISSTVTAAKESIDGYIYIVSAYNVYSQNLSKIDTNGNIVWTKQLHETTGGYQQYLNIEVTPDGGVVAISNSPSSPTFNISRFDNNGILVWQKRYDLNMVWSSNLKNLLFKDGYIYVGGNVQYNNFSSFGSFICKLNYKDGQTIWTKNYAIGTSTISLGDMISSDSTIVLNIISSTGNSLKPTIGGIMRIDTSGKVLKSMLISEDHIPNSIKGPFGASSSRLTKSGQSYYILTAGAYPLLLQGDGTNSKQIKLDADLQVQWVKSSGGVSQPRYYFNAPAANEGYIIAGTYQSPSLSPNSYGTKLAISMMDSSGGKNSVNCYFYNQNWEIFNPTINVTSVQWTVDSIATNIAEYMTFPWSNFYPEMRYKCPDYVDSCSYLKLSGPQSICNLNQNYVFKSHKNKTCGQPTKWFISNDIKVVEETDSSITVKFLNFGRHILYGRNLLGCAPVEDSLEIIATSKSGPLDLGNDQQICVGNQLTLHAGKKFMKYEWQDQSIDSILTINRPGQYWVKVTDSCNNILIDTVNISLATTVPISIGIDRSICVKDTVHLSATPGFLNYQWGSTYQTSSNTGQSIIVNPLIDTIYTVIAEKTPGCFAFDTVRITVYSSPIINLGTDKNICSGDSLVLDAGTGFTSYKWNTNANVQQIIVKGIGTYSILAITSNGCKSYDTISVLKVNSLPKPQLDQNSILCEGIPRDLNAGSGYVQYQWNTGATTRNISINNLGIYSVVVKDANGCKGTDTVKITNLQPAPVRFLSNDTAICSFETILLQPNKSYNNYLWSTGSISTSITAKDPGLYWLQVKDGYGCIGRDSINILLKSNCIYGVYVPSAFTPNGDGKNDLFKPLIYGNVLQYVFKVYNRWGEIVFQSNTPGQGWDGRFKGLKQEAFNFVWTLMYQLDGEPVHHQQGTVLLMR
jgi:gliding motility-associated-like protein